MEKKHIYSINYRHLIESAVIGVYNTTFSGELLFINNAFAKMLEYSSVEELMSLSILNLYYDPIDREKLLKELHRNKRVDNYEIRMLTQKGRVKYFLLNSILEENIISGFVLDYTSKKIAEEEIKRARDYAEEMTRLKTNFLSNISHELRTPIIGIIGFAELLDEELTNTELKPFVEAISDSGHRLKDTIEMILELTHIESSKEKLSLTETKLGDIAEDVVTIYKEYANRKNLYLNLEVVDDDLIVWTDPKMCQQVINCLIKNAIKFTFSGGVSVVIKEEIINHRVWGVIKVIDTGVGIDENNQHAFTEFRQGSEGSSRKFQGIGLGLAIAKKYVELMSGQISYTSSVNKGTTFTVRLQAFETRKEITEAEEIISGRKNLEKKLKTILLVEDDPVTRKTIQLQLKGLFNVDEAPEGVTAINMVKQKKYSAILMDVNLKQELNGIEVSKIIRKMREYEQTPIIAVTAYAHLLDSNEIKEVNFREIIAKPFIRETLVKKLSAILPS